MSRCTCGYDARNNERVHEADCSVHNKQVPAPACGACGGDHQDWTVHGASLSTRAPAPRTFMVRQLAEAQATIAALKTELSAAQAAIAALQWTEITPDNLPKPLVHEVLDPVRGFVGTVFASWPYGRSIEAGWFYFRPISPPAQASATEVKHEG